MKNNILLCLSIIGIVSFMPMSSMAQRAITTQQACISQSASAGVGLIPPGGQGKI